VNLMHIMCDRVLRRFLAATAGIRALRTAAKRFAAMASNQSKTAATAA